MDSSIVYGIVASLLVEICIGVAYDGACDTNATCTDASTYCQASISPTCSKGKCKCLIHMVWDSTDSKCKVKKYFVDKCNTTLTSCQGGSQCSGPQGQCVCNGLTNNYYIALKRCIDHTSTWKMIGEDCTTVDNCYQGISRAVECVLPTGSSGTQKTCQCTSGYIEENFSCRKPHYGEKCTPAVGCTQEIAVTESSIITETCSNISPNICTCPSGSTQKSLEKDGLITNMCMSDFTGTPLSVGSDCGASNECETSKCEMCPENTIKKCVAAPSS